MLICPEKLDISKNVKLSKHNANLCTKNAKLSKQKAKCGHQM